MTSYKRVILEDVLPLSIIREVEKWPVLYKKRSSETTSPHFRYKIWEKIAKNLFDDFDSYSIHQQQAKVHDLTRKWRNLRDTFKRQLMVEKKIREGHNILKKEYVHFRDMAFLLPHMSEDGDSDARHTQRQARKRRRAHQGEVSKPADVMQPRDHIDEDKHFLLSLLPSLQRMSEDEKLTAKMDILKVIKDVKNKSASQSYVLMCNVNGDELRPGSDAESVVVKEEPFTVEVDESGRSNALSDTDSDDTVSEGDD